ncbi:nitroreductase family protein [Chitinibacteraceae bacterium HSL-7]
MFDLDALITSRISCNHFDPSFTLDQSELTRLIELATRAPSAYNAQNWRFVVVHSEAAKAALLQHAYGQSKVAEGSATVIVVGRLGLHRELADALQPSVEAGLFAADLRDTMVHYATEGYADHPQAQRDEAIRSASLAAMTLMLAAQGRGLASCPMIGFDAQAVAREFGLAADEIPVMLVVLGREGTGNWPQKPRKPLEQVLRFA